MSLSNTGNTVEIYRGNNRTLSVTIYKPDGEKYPLTGCTVKLYIKKKVADDNDHAVITLTGTITDANNGVVEFYFLPSTTNNATILKNGFPYPFDIEVTTGDDTPQYYTALRSTITIKQP